MKRHYTYSLLGAGLIAVGAIAYAEKGEPANEPETDSVPVTQAPVSLVQAVQTAELRAGGKAREAEYTHSREGWVYEVEVFTGTKVFDVRVDSTTGSVISSEEDVPDRDERHDRKD